MENTCSSCGSNKIMHNLSVVDKGDAGVKHELAIESYSKPDALLFKGTKRHPLKATVSGACGKVNLSVENSQELWQNHQKK
jgi:hypothetical protein